MAANNAELGGGEVMLLATAQAARNLGWDVHVVGPASTWPRGVIQEAQSEGFRTTALPGERGPYVLALRRWHRRHPGLLWCHGLVPALATSGRRDRIVHLHQVPLGGHRFVASMARTRASVTLVPSRHAALHAPGAEVLWNWCDAVSRPAHPGKSPTLRVGFLGRLSVDKGVAVLAEAVRILDGDRPGSVRGIVAGEPIYVGGDQREGVERALQRTGPLLTAIGWVPRDTFFSEVDVAVFPSVWPESFGLVAAEAMSARVPVVVSDAGALPEVVGPNHPWVARAGDAEDLARVLRLVRDADDAAVAKVTDAAYERWREHFSPSAGRERVARLLAAHS